MPDYVLKDELAAWLREAGHEVIDLGTNGPESVDYPEFGAKLADAVATGEAERGIVVCGSGIGISIAVNRNPALPLRPGRRSAVGRRWPASIMTPTSSRSARG